MKIVEEYFWKVNTHHSNGPSIVMISIICYHRRMAGALPKRFISPIIAAILVLVIFGVYILIITDPPDGIEISGKKLGPARVFDKFDHSDWLAENSVGINRGNNDALLRSGVFRELILFAMHSTDGYLSELSIQTAKNNYYSGIIDAIQIKLRI